MFLICGREPEFKKKASAETQTRHKKRQTKVSTENFPLDTPKEDKNTSLKTKNVFYETLLL